jgi:hypothetical protein
MSHCRATPRADAASARADTHSTTLCLPPPCVHNRAGAMVLAGLPRGRVQLFGAMLDDPAAECESLEFYAQVRCHLYLYAAQYSECRAHSWRVRAAEFETPKCHALGQYGTHTLQSSAAVAPRGDHCAERWPLKRGYAVYADSAVLPMLPLLVTCRRGGCQIECHNRKGLMKAGRRVTGEGGGARYAVTRVHGVNRLFVSRKTQSETEAASLHC